MWYNISKETFDHYDRIANNLPMFWSKPAKQTFVVFTAAFKDEYPGYTCEPERTPIDGVFRYTCGLESFLISGGLNPTGGIEAKADDNYSIFFKAI